MSMEEITSRRSGSFEDTAIIPLEIQDRQCAPCASPVSRGVMGLAVGGTISLFMIGAFIGGMVSCGEVASRDCASDDHDCYSNDGNVLCYSLLGSLGGPIILTASILNILGCTFLGTLCTPTEALNATTNAAKTVWNGAMAIPRQIYECCTVPINVDDHTIENV